MTLTALIDGWAALSSIPRVLTRLACERCEAVTAKELSRVCGLMAEPRRVGGWKWQKRCLQIRRIVQTYTTP